MCAPYRGEGGEGSVEYEAIRIHCPCPQKAAKSCVFSGVSAVDSESCRTNECLQGYRGIIPVLMLTMAPSESDDLERLKFAAEKLSLHHHETLRAWVWSHL